MVDAPPPFGPYTPAWLGDITGLRLAVFGADGFIGSNVVRLALAGRAHVAAIALGDPWRLKSLKHQLELVACTRWWERRAAAGLRQVFSDADAMVLLAYRAPPAGTPAQQLAYERRVNLTGCVQAASAFGEGRVVFSSSANIYGPWHDEPVAEVTPPAPATPYAEAKLDAERELAEGRAPSSLVVMRIATVYGPGEHAQRAVPSFLRAFQAGNKPVLHGLGADVHDYVHVADVAAAILNACVRPTTRADESLINIGSGVGRSTRDVLATAAAVQGVDPIADLEPSQRAPSRLILDVSRARRLLSFDPRPDFAEGLAEEAAWLLAASRLCMARKGT